MSESGEAEERPSRFLHVNNTQRKEGHQLCTTCNEQHTSFCNNYVATTKYTLLTFLPVNLFEQFRKKANFYFLIIAALSFTDLSPRAPFISVAPLVFVLGVSAIKEAYEDYQRYKQDKVVNQSPVLVWRGGGFVEIPWADIQVGDMLKIVDNAPFPADLLLLHSSLPQGMCNIETSNLDGETNLKIKQAVAATYNLETGEQGTQFPTEFSAIVESDPPTAKMDSNSWKGNLLDVPGIEGKVPLTFTQMLLRGASLRNTSWVLALVLFTGNETKLMLNNSKVVFKRSNVDRTVDRALYVIFALQGCLCVMGAVANNVWTHANASEHTYLHFTSSYNINLESAYSWFTFLVLLDLMVPISLYVSMELVKFVQAYFIDQDVDMYFAETDVAAKARTSNLNEELGQVDYIFSDKTGTLTRNKMEFLRCSVGGVSYGPGKMQESKMLVEPLARAQGIPELRDGEDRFEDARLAQHLTSQHRNKEAIDEFLTLLAVCHTVIPEYPSCHEKHNHGRENCGAPVEYQAASPDEKALVIAALQQQYYFNERVARVIQLDEQRIEGQLVAVNIMGTVHEFEILALLDFTSKRKRMSVVVRDPRDGQIKVYCKGADNVILERLSERSRKELWPVNDDHLSEFAAEGLRTLVCAMRVVPVEEFKEWLRAHQEAESSMEDREGKLALSAQRIEVEFELLGSTGIEDKLQDGVPDTIAKLAQANIKIWVLTGDKVETAINIGKSCKLINRKMQSKGLMVVNPDEKLDHVAADEITIREMRECWQRVKDKANGSDDECLVISGKALSAVFPARELDHRGREIEPSDEQLEQEKERQQELLQLCLRCKAIVCCRVSPIQKAQVVSLVKKNVHGSITLAIGDGANDVSMIKAAHVGIGISGFEGLQAVMASDYAIGQFRFLLPLLLVHGAYSYRRVGILILYSFYKNVTITFTQVWFAFYTGFSGQVFYDAFAGSLYNMVFTAFPVMLTAVFNRDYTKESALKAPELYWSGQANHAFNLKLMAMFILEGVFHSLVLFFGSIFTFDIPTESSGLVGGHWLISTVMYSACVIVVNLRIGLQTRTWTWMSQVLFWASIVVWFIFIAVYSNIYVLSPNMFGVGTRMLGIPAFWLTIMCITVVCILPDVVVNYVRRMYWFRNEDIVNEIEKGYGEFCRPDEGQPSPSRSGELELISVRPGEAKEEPLAHDHGYAPFQVDVHDPDYVMSQTAYLHRQLSHRSASSPRISMSSTPTTRKES